MSYYNKQATQVCEWIVSETEIHTVAQFREKIREFACIDSNGDHVHKNLWKDHYQENIIVSSKGLGRNNLIYCADRNDSVENKVTQALLAVANIIKDEIRSIKFNNDVSPTLDDISWSNKSRQ